MRAQTAVPFVDTNIIPDRNAGIGSLLWDLQNPRAPDRDGPPLLDRAFAFIDVGVSRAKVATTLKTLLARDLGMDVDYVATQRAEAVPYANVVPLGDGAQKIRGCLGAMISSKEAAREVTHWHCVVDRQGKVAAVAYSYALHGNEVGEAYFMGRPFMVSGESVEFADPALDEVLADDVAQIEARVALESRRDGDPTRPGPSWDGFRMERNPLQAGLAECGIALQATDVPRRVRNRQNVLFLGNVLNHYPQVEQARELDRVAANLEDGDIVIVQVDETDASFVDVLRVKGQGAGKTRERVRWIDTRKLEVRMPASGAGSWRRIPLKPGLEPIADRLVDCLRTKANSPQWSREGHRVLARRTISHVFGTFFRALPVEQILRVAVREALRRLPAEEGLKGIPVFEGDATDAYGGALELDFSPIVPEADLHGLGLSSPPARSRQPSGKPATRGAAVDFGAVSGPGGASR